MILARSTAKPKIGPLQHGRKMSLKAFEFANVEEGFTYELARGYVVVSEVPNYPHASMVGLLRNHLGRFHLENPQIVHLVLEGGSNKLVIFDWESERHPDIASGLDTGRCIACGAEGDEGFSKLTEEFADLTARMVKARTVSERTRQERPDQ